MMAEATLSYSEKEESGSNTDLDLLNETPKLQTNNQTLYDERIEKFYHNEEKMNCLGVLLKEKELMEYVIENKQNRNEEYDYFFLKLQRIEVKISSLQSEIEFEMLNFDDYKKIIGLQLDYEKKLLDIMDGDKTIVNKDQTKERIKKRIEIIKEELTQQIDVEMDKKNSNNLAAEKEVKDSTFNIYQNKGKQSDAKGGIKELEPTANLKSLGSLDDIKLKLDEYRKALEYFLKIESSLQAEDARSKAKILNDFIKKIESNPQIKIDLDATLQSLPPSITPEYICGYTQQERIKKFSQIIKYFIDKKKEVQLETQKLINQFKTMNKREFLQRKDEIKQTLDSMKSKQKYFLTLINKLRVIVKDSWTPAPLIYLKEVEEKIEKINDCIAVNTVNLKIGQLNYQNKNVYLQIILPYTNDKSLNEYINQNGNNNFNYEHNLKLDKYTMKTIPKKTLEILLFKKGFCCFKNKKIGHLTIKLDDLKVKSEIEGEFEISFDENKSSGANKKKIHDLKNSLLYPMLNVSLKIRTPVNEREYETFLKNEMEITKFFPSFKGDQIQTQKINPIIEESSNSEKEDKSKKSEEEIILKPKPTTNRFNMSPEGLKINFDISEFTPEEIESPDVIDNLNSIKVLQAQIDKYQEEINRIEGRAPKNLKEKFLKCKVKFKTLENEIGCGNITIDQYILIMKNQLDHDKKLIAYFKSIGKEENTEIVSNRISLLIAEMDEAIAYAKSSKK